MRAAVKRHHLVACDFDQTLSFNDSGEVLSALIGASSFEQKVAGLSAIHLVQPGAELTYLLRHDPEFRCVRHEHLVEAGERVRLKVGIEHLVAVLDDGIEGCRFSFRVISAAPRPIVESALAGIVPAEHIHAAEFEFDPASGEICAVTRVPAGYGKVVVLEALEASLGVSPDRTVYIGDGRSDLHVMLHVNNRGGLTVAVSAARSIAQIARRTVIGDSALSVLVPVLEDALGWDAPQIRRLFESQGLALHEWHKARTDWVTVRAYPAPEPEHELAS